MAMLIAATAALGAFAGYRFTRAGQWLPTMPLTVGEWEGVDAPIPNGVLKLLGDPPPMAAGRQYISPFSSFGEVVYASVVCAGPFENYHDPTVCVPGGGFTLTGKKVFAMDEGGKGNVRAMVFKRPTGQYGDVRILMYYWQQNRKGETATEARMGNYRDLGARWNTGFGSVVLGNQNVLVRVYTFIQPNDPKGVQAQRNVEQISRALYKHIETVGSQ
jgi:hypothetical protein